MNHGVLAFLHPEQVEVEIWHADEREVGRGLSSELDEMWLILSDFVVHSLRPPMEEAMKMFQTCGSATLS